MQPTIGPATIVPEVTVAITFSPSDALALLADVRVSPDPSALDHAAYLGALHAAAARLLLYADDYRAAMRADEAVS